MTRPATQVSPDSAALRQACERLGIATHYENFWGETQAVADEALDRLVQAMGADAADDGAAPGGLPPVHVVRQSQLASRPVVLAHAGAGLAQWRIDGEAGGQWDGLCEVQGSGPARIELPGDLPLGHHVLSVRGHGTCPLIVCPERCHEPAELLAGDRWWGPTVQLYALRSRRNWGIGDFGDLRTLVATAAAAGASFVGLNPLHALFAHAPERATPYSPSNRTALNALYIDVEAVPEFVRCGEARRHVAREEFQQQLASLRDAPHVQYAAVAALKHEVLRQLFAQLLRDEAAGAATDRSSAFRAFQRRHAHWLRPHALFDVLQQHFHEQDAGVHGWHQWPREFHAPQGAAVAHFERQHREDVEYAEYLQWLCDTQLAEAAEAARAAGMPLGLYRDAAVGVDAAGSDTWQQHGLYARGVSVGAPPETANPAGQSWGLPPMRPTALTAQAYAPFIELLRANMRHAGALRLDHAMALRRLFWVPAHEGPAAGTYVTYPFDDLLNILALESVREQCLVIGEDLGNVPAGFREALAERGVRSYCPLYFQRDADGAIPAPEAWPVHALAVVGTHDLPTLRAWWQGDDIGMRAALGLYADDAQRQAQAAARHAERDAVASKLPVRAPGARLDDAEAFATLSCAVHGLVGSVASELAGVQIEDIIGQAAPVNVPSTTEAQHPNWRVKLELGVDDLQADERWRRVTAALATARRRPVPCPSQGTLPLQVPRATYRVQFHAGMRFDDVTAAVPYLDALGVSHLYASPYLKARQGSTHGYDVTDPAVLNPEIGDDESHRRLCHALRERDMHQLLDVVPNHMGVLQADNPWWLDVLAHGQDAAHAETFDIDWHRGKLLLPVLGAPYGEVLAAGELVLRFDPGRGTFYVAYHDHVFPLNPATVSAVLGMTACEGADEALCAQVSALQSLAAGVAGDALAGPGAAAERRRRADVFARRLAAAVRDSRLHAWVEACVALVNQAPDAADPGHALHDLLSRQHWRLMFWRSGPDEINYRRFFDVPDLAAVRMDRSPVFEQSHARVLAWLAEGAVSGLRVDHPDGLADPEAYFERLQQRYADVLRDQGEPARPLYVVAEKILAEGEAMPEGWAVHGDTGYRFANQVNGLFVDDANGAALQRVLADFTGCDMSFDDELHRAKLQVMSTSLSADLSWLTERVHVLAQAERGLCDVTRAQWRVVLGEVAAGHEVYRTYIGARGATDTDRARLARACESAKAHTAPSLHAVVDALHTLLLGDVPGHGAAWRLVHRAFVARWQQFTAPLQAKSMEDTAFYRYQRLISLNDVGGDPRRFGETVAQFHAANAERAQRTPYTLLGTSTHDSKRSEDVRARIDVLSEIPSEWHAAVRRWSTALRSQGGHNIDSATEYLLYQTLVGVWPLAPADDAALPELRERVQACMLKSVREAKQQTSWLEPDAACEAGVSAFIDALFCPHDNAFLPDFTRWVAPVARFGAWNSLSQVLFKLTSPGVPDVYQGSETWNFSLVDPDNRRPVHFDRLHRQLGEALAFDARGASVAQADAALVDGRLKMRVTADLLALRRHKRLLFRDGGYLPLQADGPAARHVVAYARQHHGDSVVVIGTRLLATLCNLDPSARSARWEGTSLALPGGDGAPRPWRDVITGATVEPDAAGRLQLGECLGVFPFAVLVRSGVPDAPQERP